MPPTSRSPSRTAPRAGSPWATPTSSTRSCGPCWTTRWATAAGRRSTPWWPSSPRPRTSLITITDHGPGVPDEDRERLFGRFERGAGRPSGEGSGLGLYASRALCRAMGGDLELEPADPGRGASFTVRLPGGDPRRVLAAPRTRGPQRHGAVRYASLTTRRTGWGSLTGRAQGRHVRLPKCWYQSGGRLMRSSGQRGRASAGRAGAGRDGPGPPSRWGARSWSGVLRPDQHHECAPVGPLVASQGGSLDTAKAAAVAETNGAFLQVQAANMTATKCPTSRLPARLP